MLETQKRFEGVGEPFSVEKLWAARDKTFVAVKRIADAIQVGMQEEDANILAKNILVDMGMEKEWHPCHVRFGTNTTKIYKEASQPGVILQENDIYFIDIGPVFDSHEGDAGDTFVMGDDPEKLACARAVRELFNCIQAEWKTKHATGLKLYQFAEKTAEAMGYRINLGALGHRIGDFPHAIYKADHLSRLDFAPTANLWILEVQIRHPTKAFGAFYEDILQ